MCVHIRQTCVYTSGRYVCAYGVVVRMLDFQSRDPGSNPGQGNEIS